MSGNQPERHGAPWATSFRRAKATKSAGSRPAANIEPDFLHNDHLIQSLREYSKNDFVQFLLSCFQDRRQFVEASLTDYFIGTWDDGAVVFWQIDKHFRIRTGKVMHYNRSNGRRDKQRPPNWVHAILKNRGTLPAAFNLEQVFFGEHLLVKYPERPIAVVEAEKTALIASISQYLGSDIIWLACGSMTNLKLESLRRIGKNRKLILYPDSDAFKRWKTIGEEARSAGLSVGVSTTLETQLTDGEKLEGYDIADFLIAELSNSKDDGNSQLGP